MATRLHLRERAKGVIAIIIIVSIGLYTWPPILACMIVGVCADEYFRILSLLLSVVDTSSSSASPVSPSTVGSTLAESIYVRIAFVSSCVSLSIFGLLGYQAMTCACLVWSFIALVYVMFYHVERPGEKVPVQKKSILEEPSKADDHAVASLTPIPSLYLSSTPEASATTVLLIVLPIFGLWYAGWLFSHTVLILQHPSLQRGSVHLGVRRIVHTIFATAGGENGGLVGGSLFGHTKLCPRISPNKSREGAIGQLIVSPIVSAVFAYYIDVGLNIPESLLLGVVLGFVGIFGDLLESFLKRTVGLKDAGSIIPGAGGMLDRMDGLIFNFPLVYYALEYAHSHLETK